MIMNHLPLLLALTIITLIASCKKEPLDSLLKVTMDNGDVIYVHPTSYGGEVGVQWGGYGTDIIDLTNVTFFGDPISDFDGEANTEIIVAQVGANNGESYAAQICKNLVSYGFDDWYLPAAGELNEVFKKIGPNGSGQIKAGYSHWSSTEVDSNSAWVQYSGAIYSGVSHTGQRPLNKNSYSDPFSGNLFTGPYSIYCRCIRR